MKNRNMEIINSEIINPQTYKWKNFGMNVAEAIHALCELVHNAYAACITSKEKRVYVDILVEDGDTFLYVKNSGNPADLARVLDYGNRDETIISNETRTKLNQNGTGFKTAASYFNPANNGWTFYTRHNNFCKFVEAPYSDTMEIKTATTWPFGDNIASVVKIKVDNPQKLENLKASDLGYYYSLAIEKDNLEILFNGEKVNPIFPKGASNSSTEMVDICGTPVQIDYTTYQLGYDQKDEPYYAMGQADQGVYVFVNHCLAIKSGLSLIKKKYGGKTNMSMHHPSANGMIAIIDIIPPADRSKDVPFTNTKNNIDWHNSIGRAYRDAINDLVGNFFRSRYENSHEAGRRRFLDYITSSVLSGIAHYNVEYAISKELKADAVIGTRLNKKGKIDPDSVLKIIEFKKDKVTSHHIGQLMSYYHALIWSYENNHPEIDPDKIQEYYNPEIIIVGQTLLPEAEYRMKKEAKGHGVSIKFLRTDKIAVA